MGAEGWGAGPLADIDGAPGLSRSSVNSHHETDAGPAVRHVGACHLGLFMRASVGIGRAASKGCAVVIAACVLPFWAALGSFWWRHPIDVTMVPT